MDLVVCHCGRAAAGQEKKYNNLLLHWNSVSHGLRGRLWNRGNNLMHLFLFHSSVSMFHHPGHTSQGYLSVVALDLRSTYQYIEDEILFSLTNLKHSFVWINLFLTFRWWKVPLKDKKEKSVLCSLGERRGRGPANSVDTLSIPFLLFHRKC